MNKQNLYCTVSALLTKSKIFDKYVTTNSIYYYYVQKHLLLQFPLSGNVRSYAISCYLLLFLKILQNLLLQLRYCGSIFHNMLIREHQAFQKYSSKFFKTLTNTILFDKMLNISQFRVRKISL